MVPFRRARPALRNPMHFPEFPFRAPLALAQVLDLGRPIAAGRSAIPDLIVDYWFFQSVGKSHVFWTTLQRAADAVRDHVGRLLPVRLPAHPAVRGQSRASQRRHSSRKLVGTLRRLVRLAKLARRCSCGETSSRSDRPTRCSGTTSGSTCSCCRRSPRSSASWPRPASTRRARSSSDDTTNCARRVSSPARISRSGTSSG